MRIGKNVHVQKLPANVMEPVANVLLIIVKTEISLIVSKRTNSNMNHTRLRLIFITWKVKVQNSKIFCRKFTLN